MPRFSFIFYRFDKSSLTVYKSKPDKKVLILSSKHQNVKVDSLSYKKLPETVSFYNKTKFGVDVTDQMARKYTVKSASRRWPLQVFFNILDLAGINSWILYTSDGEPFKSVCQNLWKKH
jgi:CO dehydrogenase/acetyl-CoA synthase gamma subunit (corrinoid Fe-S protein)